MPSEKETGLAALQRGDFANAIPALESAILSDPNDFDAHLYLGAAYSQTERHTEGVETLTKAVYLQPMNAQVRYNLAVAFERAGWNEQAIEVLQQVLQIQPDYAQAQQALTRLQPPAPVLPPMSAPQVAPGYAPPGQGAMPGYAPPGQTPAPIPVLQRPQTYGSSAQMPNPAPQPIYAPPVQPASISNKSIAGGIVALFGIAIGTGFALGYIMVEMRSPMPIGVITGYTTGKAARFFAGGATSATGVIAALFAAITCGTIMLVLKLSGFDWSSILVSSVLAVIWAYRIANGSSKH